MHGAIAERHNAADDCFLTRPKGACLCRHCGVTLLVKDLTIYCGARLALPTEARSECYRIGGGGH